MSLIGHKLASPRIVAFVVSATLHGVAAAALIGFSSTDPPAPLPMIAVEIVAQGPSGAGGPATAKGARTPRAGARRAALTKAKAKTEAKTPAPAVTKAKIKPPPLTRRSPSEAAIRPARPAKPQISKRALRAAVRSARIKRRVKPRPKLRPRPQAASYRRAKPGKNAAAGKAASTNIAALAYRPPRPGGGSYGNPLPKYPQYARRRGAKGRVVLAVQVGADGRAKSVLLRLSSGHADLDAAAIAAVRRWRFAPASRGGVSVEGLAIVPIRFRLLNR